MLRPSWSAEAGKNVTMNKRFLWVFSILVMQLLHMHSMPKKVGPILPVQPRQHINYDKWMDLAKGDLTAAGYLISEGCEEQAMFFCAQAAEKALKGYMALRKMFYSQTHDLVKLLTICENARRNAKADDGVSFNPFSMYCSYLSPLESLFRYPDVNGDGRTTYDARVAFDFAKKVFSLVNAKIEWEQINDISVLDNNDTI